MRYPIGIQSFEEIRDGGYLYVDKTEHIYNLAHDCMYYLMIRPDGFGKTLLLSTMEAYFSGRRELFEGLALDRLEDKWIRHPVLRMDLGPRTYTCEEDLERAIDEILRGWEDVYGSEERNAYSESSRFIGVIERAREMTGQRVVVLVDNYSKPMLDTVDNHELQDKFRRTLMGFYSIVKSQDRNLKFVFFTGAAKFVFADIWGGLNNLFDITSYWECPDICGVTDKELHEYFEESIYGLAKSTGMTFEQTLTELKERYGGYRFHDRGPEIYNPFSLLHAFDKGKIEDFWFDAGVPDYVLKLLAEPGYWLEKWKENHFSDLWWNFSFPEDRLISLLYYGGYLTLKKYDFDSMMDELCVPNKEVDAGLSRLLQQYES